MANFNRTDDIATARLGRMLYSNWKKRNDPKLTAAGAPQMRSATDIPDHIYYDLMAKDFSDGGDDLLSQERTCEKLSATLDIKEEVLCETFGIDHKVVQARRAPVLEAQKRAEGEFESKRSAMVDQLSSSGMEAAQIAVRLQVMAQKAVAQARALDPGVDTNQIGTDFRHDIYRELRLAGKLQPKIQAIDIPAGYKSYTAPNMNDCRILKTAANTTDAYTVNSTENPTNASTTWTPVKLMGGTFWDGEFEDDALYSVEMALRGCLKRGWDIAVDLALLSGDTLNTAGNNINASGGSLALGTKDPRLIFNGFRGDFYRGTAGGKSANTFTGGLDGGGTALTPADFYAAMQLMGKYGDPSQFSKLLTISSVQTYWNIRAQALGLYQTDLLNKDVWGAEWITMANSTATHAATSNIPTDSLSIMEGCPINLNTAGVFDNTTKTKSTVVIANMDNYLIANKRGYQIRVVSLDPGDQKAIYVSSRMDFKPIISGLTSSTVIYNVL